MKSSWREIITNFNSENISENIFTLIENIYNDDNKIYPDRNNVFHCFDFCEIDEINVVILGQDPYYSKNHASGLAFATLNKDLPPSLNNIKKLLKSDLNIELNNPNLENWASSSLTVEENKPGSHIKLWNKFIDYIINILSERKNIVFIAWGAFAFKKLENIDLINNKLIVSSHPSPLSCNKKFRNFPSFNDSKIFSRTNLLLLTLNKKEIEW
jgi:uracil-DNA glycosylase